MHAESRDTAEPFFYLELSRLQKSNKWPKQAEVKWEAKRMSAYDAVKRLKSIRDVRGLRVQRDRVREMVYQR